MGLTQWIKQIFGGTPAEESAPAPPPVETSPPRSTPTPPASQWVMPRHDGRDICDWSDVIAQLKREGRLEEALSLATGCLDAMVETARRNPANAMEHYVLQVAVLQRKLKRHQDEITTISGWLDLGIAAPREDHRLELRKRLAKANELLARQEGRDSSAHHAEWKALVEEAKTAKSTLHAMSPPAQVGQRSVSGRSAARPGTDYRARTRGSRLVPSAEELRSPVFVSVDFETANRSGGASACQVALVKVEHGVVTDRYATLLKPPVGADHFEFTYLHGISSSDVRRAPSWPQVTEDIVRFVGNAPVYAHNASFDSRVWRQLDEYFVTASHPGLVYCTYRLAERAVPGLINYKLPTVTQHLAPAFILDHHRAESDAEACAAIVTAIQSSPQALAMLGHR